MKSVIIHADGRHINLAAAISPAIYEELEITRSPRINPVLRCGGCNGGIYIRHGSTRKDELFGAHHDAGNCAETLAIRKAAMSDEHKRMAEYHVAAARAEGLSADMEVTTSGRTRVDVVVDGRIGIEVQRSALTVRAAVDRTARSMTAGLESIAWCGLMRAQWTGKVPGYQWLDVDRVLREMPQPRSVRSRGLATFRAERGFYGRWIPKLEPLTVLVDDAVIRMAEGSIKAVIFGKHVWLIRTDGLALYEEMTGRRLAPYSPGHSVARTLAPSAVQACNRPPIPVVPAIKDVPSMACGRPGCRNSPGIFPCSDSCGAT